MAEIVPLRPCHPVAPARPGPAVFSAAIGPGRMAAGWRRDGSVGLTVSDGRSGPVEFLLDSDDVLDLVRVLVEGLDEPGPVRLGTAAPVLRPTPGANDPTEG